MSSAPSSTSGDRLSLGLLLIVALFFSWFLGIKNLVMDWVTPSSETPQVGSPNILLIVADDLGYNDTSALTSTGLDTPNLKQLANRGATFTRDLHSKPGGNSDRSIPGTLRLSPCRLRDTSRISDHCGGPEAVGI